MVSTSDFESGDLGRTFRFVGLMPRRGIRCWYPPNTLKCIDGNIALIRWCRVSFYLGN